MSKFSGCCAAHGFEVSYVTNCCRAKKEFYQHHNSSDTLLFPFPMPYLRAVCLLALCALALSYPLHPEVKVDLCPENRDETTCNNDAVCSWCESKGHDISFCDVARALAGVKNLAIGSNRGCNRQRRSSSNRKSQQHKGAMHDIVGATKQCPPATQGF